MKNFKGFATASYLAAFFMTLVLFWDYYGLKADSFSWHYIALKGTVILSYLFMALHTQRTESTSPLKLDAYGILFYVYSLYGMVYIDSTYSFSFMEGFIIMAMCMPQSRLRFSLVAVFGFILCILGHIYSAEPPFVAVGESYKPHSMTISFIFFVISILIFFFFTRYQEQINALNEKFAMIGKQSSFLMHEIKAPLSRLMINSHKSELLLLQNIRRDSEKISALVSSVETLIHHPEKLAANFSVFQLDEIATQLREDYGSYLEAMNIDFDFDRLKGPFYGNRHLMYQLLKNLIINAVEAIGNQKENRSSLAFQTDYSKDHVLIRVTNTNSQIPLKDLQRIFEPHFTTKEAGSNKGLGLTFAKSIVEAHRGMITAESKNNETSFIIDVPHFGTVPA